MMTAHEPVQKVCQNAIVFPSENVTGFRWEKKPVTPGGSWLFYLGKIRQREQSCCRKVPSFKGVKQC